VSCILESLASYIPIEENYGGHLHAPRVHIDCVSKHIADSCSIAVAQYYVVASQESSLEMLDLLLADGLEMHTRSRTGREKLAADRSGSTCEALV